MCWIGGRPGSFNEPGQSSLPLVEENDLAEGGAHLSRKLLNLLDEGQPADVLRDDHVLARQEVLPGGDEGDRPRERTALLRLFAPTPDERANPVDVEVERQRVLISEQLGQRGFAAPGRPVQQDQPRHRGSFARSPSPGGARAAARGLGEPRPRFAKQNARQPADSLARCSHGDA